jgi:hypothetical protein
VHTLNTVKEPEMSDLDDGGSSTLSDDEVQTHRFDSTPTASADDTADTGDDAGDAADAADTGDDSGEAADTSDDSGDVSDSSDTGDDA